MVDLILSGDREKAIARHSAHFPRIQRLLHSIDSHRGVDNH
jgi:hypothetical protein